MAILRVRKWCVRFYQGRDLTAAEIVETINKDFARWLVRWHPARRSCDRITVTPVKEA